MDCGPTCLRMLCEYYGRRVSIQKLRALCYINKRGVNMLAISEAAEKLGFRTIGAKLLLQRLQEVKLPCILHWRQNHYIVLQKIYRGNYYIADPAKGIMKINSETFKKNWFVDKERYEGVVLILSPAPAFYELNDDTSPTVSWITFLRYFYAYKRLVVQLILGLGVGTILSLVTPVLTQSIVDVGINTRDIHFVYLILIAQLMLFLGSTSVGFVRSWILLHISTRINLSVLTDFLIKLLRLPVSFFESKTTGDIMQRMSDQQRIESFLTGTTLTAIFSIINLVVFTAMLSYYSVTIFIISLTSTVLYCLWIFIFLKRRRQLNYKQFNNSSDSQTKIVELVSGIHDIKLNNCERQKRWSWEHIQAQLFKYKIQNLALNQSQQGGSAFINQAKNIFITFLSVRAVIDGQISLGGMMAIQYIVGQISNPIEQILSFVQNYQDARISLDRLNEIHNLPDEEPEERTWLNELPISKTIVIQDLTFTYPGAGNDPVLQNINLVIPQGKTTAIVGMSGSGKTTLLKLLLRFYETQKGALYVGGVNLGELRFRVWREACGTVLQDGFLFSDTIENNIAVGDEQPDPNKLRHAINVANINDFIDDLPFGIHTKIGSTGNGISQGQKQRLLIARAVYKNPDYLFFDEATNALDANNERIIMDNLQEFFKGRTVVVVAHRLSTVSKADNIIVLDKGRVIEQGTHEELSRYKGEYYNLVKNQLELGV